GALLSQCRAVELDHRTGALFPFLCGQAGIVTVRTVRARHSARPCRSLSGAATDYRVIQGLNCSSFFKRAAIDSASRRVGNFPTRTRQTAGVPFGGASTYAV